MDGESMKNFEDATDVVREFVRYQQTGDDFDSAWTGIERIVRAFAASHLLKLGVIRCSRSTARARPKHGRGAFAGDESAIDDVVHDTALVLMALADANAKGKFDASKAAPGISGLRGWLWRVVESQAVNWVRDTFGRRGLAVKTESSLTRQYHGHRGEPGGFFDQLAAKPERRDLLPILEACIVLLPDAFHGDIVFRKLHDELSIRQTAKVLMVPTSRVQRHLIRALAVLKHLVERHGIDGTRLDA